MKLTKKADVRALTLLFTAAYMVSYLTRSNFAAIVSEMETAMAISKSLLSLSLTGSFAAYGAGQLVSGFFGDRVSPKRLVTLGLLASSALNAAMIFAKDPYLMLLIWSLNGFAQAFLWPPIVRLMTAQLSPEDYKKSVTWVVWGGSFGLIVLYAVSPLLISLWGYQTVFAFSALCGAAMVLVWNRLAQDVPNMAGARQKIEGKGALTGLFTPVIAAVMAAIILQGMLRDGVTTWMPSYIADTYHMGAAASILTGVVMPVFAILCIRFSSALHIRVFENPAVCGGVFFAAGLAAAALLRFVTGHSAAGSVLASAILTGAMHGANLMLVCMIPAYFEKFGNVSTASGVINACTYIGSSISTYGIAAVSDTFGWNVTLGLWIAVAAAGTGLCLAAARGFRRQYMQ